MDLQRLTAVALLSVVIGCVAACDPSPSQGATVSSTPLPGVALHGRVALTGDYTFSSAFTAPALIQSGAATTTPVPASSCRMYAAASSSGAPGDAFVLPTVEITNPRPVFITVTVRSGYHGPGTYSGAAVPSMSGRAAVDIIEAGGYATQTYLSTDASPMTLTVHADGSGAFSFDRWRTDEVRGGNIAGHLNGTVTWTCG